MENATWTLSPEVVVTVLEDSAVLLDLQTKYFYSVNAVGWAIVQMLESGATTDQILAQCTAWGAPEDQAAPVNAFVETFIRDNLVIQASAASSEPCVPYADPWCLPSIEKHPAPLERVMVSAFDPSLPLAE